VTTPGRQTDPPRTPWASDPARRRLSAREREIAILVADGLKDVVIARRLGLSTSTVGTHVRRIRTRLGLNDRAGIIEWVAARRTSAAVKDGLRRGGDE
jgi:DNA-binding NarL/FixJ family response regulator